MKASLRARIYCKLPMRIIMVLVFAFLCTAIANAELWQPDWTVKPGTPAPVTLRLPSNYFRITMLRSEFTYLPATPGGCSDLVPMGATVAPETECAGLVEAYESSRRPVNFMKLASLFVFFTMLGLLLSGYMSKEGMGRSQWLRSQITVFTLLTFLAAGCKAILLFTPLPFVILPVAFAPMLISTLLGRRLSFAAALSSSLVVAALLNFNVQALFIFLVSGLSMVGFANDYKRRNRKMIVSGITSALAALSAAVLTTLLFAGTLDIYDDLFIHYSVSESIWLGSLISGFASGALGLLLLSPVSWMVGEVPRHKLFELQELGHPLLKKIQQQAPATWEHSRAMANLAEAAIHSIGGNELLTRVGAHFHDVGKSENPMYFIENQAGGDNPHDNLRPHESTEAIFNHVVQGVKLLRKEHVPEDVVEFAFTHHGTSTLEYFWYKNQAENNPDKLSLKDFQYPGCKPVTKETAVVMIVDAVEAASKTIDNPDKLKFESLIQKIVFKKMAQGQFDECGLTILELKTVIRTLLNSLISMYHVRIKYQWQEEDDKREKPGDTGSQATARATTPSGGQPIQSPGQTGSSPAQPTPQQTGEVSVQTPAPQTDAVEIQGTSSRPDQTDKIQPIPPAGAKPNATAPLPAVTAAPAKNITGNDKQLIEESHGNTLSPQAPRENGDVTKTGIKINKT